MSALNRHEGATTRINRTRAQARRLSSTRVPRVEPIHYLFLFPMLILFTAAITGPALVGIFFSLTNSIGFGDWKVIGLSNYAAAFNDPAVLSSFLFTFGFAVVTVVLVNVSAFLLAVGLTSRIRLKTPLRTIFVMPMMISGIVIAYVFNFLFSNPLPQLGATVGIEPLATSLLANPDLAWVSIVIVTAWQSIPGALLVYIAGLLAIPGELYEAAGIDGASPWQRLFRITIPLVLGYVVINVVIGFKNYLSVYDVIVGLTNGGPGTATRSISMTIITGFTGGDYAYQMASATIFLVCTILLSLLQLSLTRGRNAL